MKLNSIFGKKEETESSKRKIGQAEIEVAAQILREYKNAKSSLETRIVEDEQWWKLRHLDGNHGNKQTESVSAWLFNTLTNKHADAMDSFPEASVLPREEDDYEEAKKLSAILPSIMEHNNFEDIYSNNWWYNIYFQDIASRS